MPTHPVFLRLEGRRCVVVGADAGALAKAVACGEAGAAVTVVAPESSPALDELVAAGRVRHLARAYRAGDLAGAALAYASTRDPALIHRLTAEAADERVLLNVIDVPAACSFLSPAVVARGELQIAIGTGGASPGLAARLRREIAAQVGREYVGYVAILGAVRRVLATDPARAATRGEVIAALLASPLLALVRDGRRADVDALLVALAGEDCTVARLGVVLDERVA